MVICDSTNLQPWQTAPYTDLIRRYGYQVVSLNLTLRDLWTQVAAQQVPPEKPYAHGVPEARRAEFIHDFNEYDELLNPLTAVAPNRITIIYGISGICDLKYQVRRHISIWII